MKVSRKTLVWLLAASVIVNLFFVAFGATRMLRSERREPRAAMFRLGRALGKDAPPEVRRAMREHMEGARPHRRALREARREVRAALEAEPFDPERLEAALAGLREHSQRAQQAMHAGLTAIAKELTPEQRRQLAQENLGRSKRRPQRP
jgi:uncharacterized membrane protein